MKNQEMAYNRIWYCILTVFFVCVTILLVSGCSKKEDDYTGYYVYCLDTNETKVIGEKYIPKGKNGKEIVKELLRRMENEPEDISFKKAIPDNVKLDDFTLSSQGDLCLYWTSSYGNYTGVSEILRRAAIVKTLCQVPDVENVQFYVSGQPLTDSNMEPVGFMTADTFIDTTGEIAYKQNTTLKIYFANKEGTALRGVPVKITYDATISIEQLALEQLIKGPEKNNSLKNEELIKTIPNGTKINTITVKDNTCYLDLSSDFMEKRSGISDEVAIYSVVNTLVELPNINRVQFSIDGEQVLLYDDVINFGEPFESNLDVIER